MSLTWTCQKRPGYFFICCGRVGHRVAPPDIHLHVEQVGVGVRHHDLDRGHVGVVLGRFPLSTMAMVADVSEPFLPCDLPRFVQRLGVRSPIGFGVTAAALTGRNDERLAHRLGVLDGLAPVGLRERVRDRHVPGVAPDAGCIERVLEPLGGHGAPEAGVLDLLVADAG